MILPFLFGIYVSLRIEHSWHIPDYLIFTPLIGLLAFIYWPSLLVQFKYRWIFGAIVHFLTFIVGVELANERSGCPDSILFEKIQLEKIKPKTYLLKINDVQEKANSVKLIVSGDKLPGTNSLIYAEKDIKSLSLCYGDIIVARIQWKPTEKPRNPEEFDYRKYLANRGIYLQSYIKSKDFKILRHNQGNFLVAKAETYRKKLVSLLKSNGLAGNESSVGAAILLGEMEGFSPEIQDAYSGAGVVHILSVSGLHVGIVFMLFNALFGFMDKNRKTRFIKSLLMIFIMWGYALFTGLSAPVLRAAAMFTFILIGKTMKQNCDILNTLSASALLLLIINPLLLMDIGFELTYLAVLGIVLFEKPVSRLWEPDQNLIDKVWKLIVVSVAAQLTTGPLATYYFHQFPVYFIPANLVIIPLSSMVMYSGIAALVLLPVGVLGCWSTWLFGFMVKLMNSIALIISGLPFSVVQGINLTMPEMIILYGSIFFLLQFLVNQRNVFLFLFISGMICIGIYSSVVSFYQQKQHILAVYHIPKSAAVGIIYGNSHIFLADSTLIKNNLIKKRALGNWLTSKGIAKENEIKLPKEGFLLVKSGKSKASIISGQNHIKYLFVYGNHRVGNENAIVNYHPDTLIINGNVGYKNRIKWKKLGKIHKIPCLDIDRQGCFVLRL